MKTVLVGLGGFAAGCVTSLLLRLPWFPPLNSEVSQVVTGLSSAALAVLGAFWLWRYQLAERQRGLATILVPVFDPMYSALCQFRDVGIAERAKPLLTNVRAQTGLGPPSDHEVANYQAALFPEVASSLQLAAEGVLDLWRGVQDLVVGLQPAHARDALLLYNVVRGLPSRVDVAVKRAGPHYLDEIAPSLDDIDRLQLDWAIGTFARVLNSLDGGSRDAASGAQVESVRRSLVEGWGARHA